MNSEKIVGIVDNNQNTETVAIKLLWVNSDGAEVDLNDPVAFQKELEREKLRYRLYLQNRFITDEVIYKNISRSKNPPATLMQKLKNRADRKGTTLSIELRQTIYKHMEAYKSKLKKEKEKLIVKANIPVQKLDKIWYHRTTAYDMSITESAIAYINRRALNHIGGRHTPENLKARLLQLKQEVLPKLECLGYNDISKKLTYYIDTQISILDRGIIPEELQKVQKRPTLIKQVRNKNYDISNKYAFGTYLSFSHRDMIKQNPEMSEEEARKAVCNKVMAELSKEPTNPTTTTALKQLESIIDSPIEFYNFIHAKRLASKRSAEKRKQNQLRVKRYKI